MMTDQEPEPLTYTIDEAAALLGISRGLAYRQAAEGKLPVVTFGKRKLVPRAALHQLLEQALS
jgi:excisionase family DNA binding protein